jgi:ribosomal 50S subunit-recycling heat shock protein
MAAKRLCEGQKALVNGQPVKPSHEIQAGEELNLIFPMKEIRVKVLEIPVQKSVSKHDRPQYVQVEDLGEPRNS